VPALNVDIYYRDYPPDGRQIGRGIDKAVHGLAEAVSHAGANVTILCEGDSDHETTNGHQVVIRQFSRQDVANPLAIGSSFRRYLDSAPPDKLFILNGIFNPGVAAVAEVLRRLGHLYIAAPHDPYHPAVFQVGRLKKWIYWHLREKQMLRGASAIQVLDRRHEQYLREHRIHTPILDLANGFDPIDVPDEAKLKFSTDPKLRLLYLGRVDMHNKGLDLIVMALSRLPAEYDVELTIQGPNQGDHDLVGRIAARHGIGDRVRLLEADFSSRPTAIMNEYDLFVLPSRFEGFGLAALEAMLVARPVLLTEIAGLAPHVRASGAGRVCESDADSILESLTDLLKCRDQWKPMGLAGRHYVLQNLTWESVGVRAVQNYRHVLRSAAAASAVPTTA
jgi:glycosyltransferase involved in cell wall biosynthesis